MPARITLTVTRGQLQGQKFVFADRTTCVVGRADDCSPRLPNDEDHRSISRHHCLLDINPPDARVRDFGSLNGTFVNSKKIGQRGRDQTPEQGARIASPEVDLKEGDVIELGDTAFRVTVFVPAFCSGCSAEIPEAQRTAAERTPGHFVCATCHEKAETRYAPPPPVKHKVCAQCGKNVSGEAAENRPGEFICALCKADPTRIAERLLELSNTGDENLLAVHGYHIVRELGNGGMGAVYLARHEATGEQVALKVMLPRIAADAHARDLFLREIENTRALRHANVVWLRDAVTSQGAFFFTLEYCDGGSVARLAKDRGAPLPVEEAAPIVLQALDGLEYAHNAFGPGNGLVHRDLKPDNLFLCGAGPSRVAKVGDYGLAKGFDAAGLSGLTRTGNVGGTPGFMPREQVINFKYARPEVDVWAMAACFYYLLTGCFPRDFPRGTDCWLAILQNDAVPIRRRNAAVPKRLAEVIDQALVEKPEIPFKTAAELKQAIEGALSR